MFSVLQIKTHILFAQALFPRILLDLPQWIRRYIPWILLQILWLPRSFLFLFSFQRLVFEFQLSLCKNASVFFQYIFFLSLLYYSVDAEDSKHWLVGSSKTANLQFRCVALSSPPVNSPGAELHMTYKTVQAETKLLCAVLNAHGMREVSTPRRLQLCCSELSPGTIMSV